MKIITGSKKFKFFSLVESIFAITILVIIISFFSFKRVRDGSCYLQNFFKEVTNFSYFQDAPIHIIINKNKTNKKITLSAHCGNSVIKYHCLADEILIDGIPIFNMDYNISKNFIGCRERNIVIKSNNITIDEYKIAMFSDEELVSLPSEMIFHTKSKLNNE